MARNADTILNEEIDLRDTHLTGSKSAADFYEKLVRVYGSTKTGVAEMFGILTGITYTKSEASADLPSQIIVYMEGQQTTTFDATKSGIWISIV